MQRAVDTNFDDGVLGGIEVILRAISVEDPKEGRELVRLVRDAVDSPLKSIISKLSGPNLRSMT
jgi:hypothetical protein